MSDMFANYENLSSTYVPNNQKKELVKQEIFNQDIPKKEYDMNGNFIGYSFAYGDTVEIEYFLDKTVCVEEDAIIYERHDEKPDSTVEGYKGQKAYNTYDLNCWICESLDQSIYNWKKLDKFVVPENGKKSIHVKSNHIFTNSTAKVTISNFRYEEVYSASIELSPNESSAFSIVIDKELSTKLLKGIYNCLVEVFNENNLYVDSSFKLFVNTSTRNIIKGECNEYI